MPTREKAVVLCVTGATDVKPGSSASIQVPAVKQSGSKAVRQSGSTSAAFKQYKMYIGIQL